MNRFSGLRTNSRLTRVERKLHGSGVITGAFGGQASMRGSAGNYAVSGTTVSSTLDYPAAVDLTAVTTEKGVNYSANPPDVWIKVFWPGIDKVSMYTLALAPAGTSDWQFATVSASNMVTGTGVTTGTAQTGATWHTFHNLMPNTQYIFKIATSNALNNPGIWTAETSASDSRFLTSADTQAPATPTNAPTVTGAVTKLIVEFDACTEADWDVTEVHVSTSSGFTPSPSTLAWKGRGMMCALDGDAGTTYYVKYIYIDTSGNESGVSPQGSAAVGYVGTPSLADVAVTTAKIANTAVDNSKLANLAVDAAKLATGAVTETKIGTSAVTNTKLADLAVDAAKLAASSVTNTKIANTAVDNSKLADLAVDSAKLASSAVTSTKIANAAVGNAAIANLAVDSAKIAAAAVTSAKIEDLAVGTAAIAVGAITNAKIGDLAVDSAKLASAAVTSAKIGEAAVGSAAIANLAVGTAHIAAGAITEAKIGSLAVTNAKIGDLAVDSAKIASGAIVEAKIGSLAVTNAKINDCSVAKLTTGSITAQVITLVTSGSTAQIKSSNYSPGSAGWSITSDGDCEFCTGTFRGTLSAVSGSFTSLTAGSSATKVYMYSDSGYGTVEFFSSSVLRVKIIGNELRFHDTSAVQQGTLSWQLHNSTDYLTITQNGLWVDEGHILSREPIRLLEGYQEYGKCGSRAYCSAAGQYIGEGSNFKTTLVNTPTSISFSGANASNISTYGAADLSAQGFSFYASSAAAGDTKWYGYYTTVGN